MRFENWRGMPLAIGLAAALGLGLGWSRTARADGYHLHPTIPRTVAAYDFTTGGEFMAPPVPYGHYAKDDLLGSHHLLGCVSCRIHALLGGHGGGRTCGFCGGKGCGHCSGGGFFGHGGAGSACSGPGCGGGGFGMGLGHHGPQANCAHGPAARATSDTVPTRCRWSRRRARRHWSARPSFTPRRKTPAASSAAASRPVILIARDSIRVWDVPGRLRRLRRGRDARRLRRSGFRFVRGKVCRFCGGKGCLSLPLQTARDLLAGLFRHQKVEYFIGAGGPVPITPGYVPYVNVTRSPRDFFAFPPMNPFDP